MFTFLKLLYFLIHYSFDKFIHVYILVILPPIIFSYSLIPLLNPSSFQQVSLLFSCLLFASLFCDPLSFMTIAAVNTSGEYLLENEQLNNALLKKMISLTPAAITC